MKKILLVLIVLLFCTAGAVPTYAAEPAQQCTQYSQINAFPKGKACNTDAGYSTLDNACCSAGVETGGVCCGKPIPQGAGSDDTSTAFVPLTNIPFIDQAGNASTLPNFLNQLYKICIGLAAVLAVLQIIRAGIMYMGGDSVTEKSAARSLIVQSLLGLLLVLSPVIVFSIINPQILSLNIDVSGLGSPVSGEGSGNPSSETPRVTTFSSPQYLLSGGFVRSRAGETCTAVIVPKYFPTLQACQTSKAGFAPYVAAPPEGVTYSNLAFDKACVAATDDSYKAPTPTPPACTN